MFVVLHPWESPRVPLIPLFITNLPFLCISSGLNHNAVSLWSHEYLSLSLCVCAVCVCVILCCVNSSILHWVSVLMLVLVIACIVVVILIANCTSNHNNNQVVLQTFTFIIGLTPTTVCLLAGWLTGLPAIPLRSQAPSDEMQSVIKLDYMISLAVRLWSGPTAASHASGTQFDTLSHTIE